MYSHHSTLVIYCVRWPFSIPKEPMFVLLICIPRLLLTLFSGRIYSGPP